MTDDKLIAMYYPNSFIENRNSLASYCLYFDEIRLVSMFDGQSDPTKYFSTMPDNIYIGVFDGDLEQDLIDDFSGLYQFIKDYRELIGNVIFYEKHLVAKKVDSMVRRLLSGKLPLEEITEWGNGESNEQKIINDLKEKYPEIENDTLLRVVPTALHLSKLNNWQLVSDHIRLPIPYFSETIRNADQLSSILAEECLSVFLPKPSGCTTQDILELRDSLSTELEAFRYFMLKAAGMLRAQIGPDCNIENLKSEATFFVKTKISPVVPSCTPILASLDFMLSGEL